MIWGEISTITRWTCMRNFHWQRRDLPDGKKYSKLSYTMDSKFNTVDFSDLFALIFLPYRIVRPQLPTSLQKFNFSFLKAFSWKVQGPNLQHLEDNKFVSILRKIDEEWIYCTIYMSAGKGSQKTNLTSIRRNWCFRWRRDRCSDFHQSLKETI